jgi:Rrf2 family protein
MLLSRSCEYALQALLYLDARGNSGFLPIVEIARARGLSASFLSKILNDLVHRGFLHSQRGVHGGVRLARPAARIHLWEIIEAIDGQDLATRCIIGLPECGNAVPCPFHDMWGKMRKTIVTRLSRENLKHLGHSVSVRGMRQPQSRAAGKRAARAHPGTKRGGTR